jgi:hypothetical protein
MHPACVFAIWDEPHRFLFACPVCRDEPLTLREKVSFHIAREDEDWMKSKGGHDRERHVYDQYDDLCELQGWGDEWLIPDEATNDHIYSLAIVAQDNWVNKTREQDVGCYQLPGGGGARNIRAVKQAQREAEEKERQRRAREGLTDGEALLRHQEQPRANLMRSTTDKGFREARENLLAEDERVRRAQRRGRAVFESLDALREIDRTADETLRHIEPHVLEDEDQEMSGVEQNEQDGPWWWDDWDERDDRSI